jgi:hypothetical protein
MSREFQSSNPEGDIESECMLQLGGFVPWEHLSRYKSKALGQWQPRSWPFAPCDANWQLALSVPKKPDNWQAGRGKDGWMFVSGEDWVPAQ